jgi:hypothetical protein
MVWPSFFFLYSLASSRLVVASFSISGEVFFFLMVIFLFPDHY